MRFAPLLILLLSCGIAFAQASVEAVVEPYLYPGEAYVAELFELDGTGYIAVQLDGDYGLLFEDSSGIYFPINDSATVLSVLTSLKVGTLDMDARIDAIRTDALNFNNSREPNERQCKQYVGLVITHPDRVEERPCFYNASAVQPVETCLLACRTVPICLTGLANNLPAIYSILYFNNASKDMSSNMSALLANLEQARALDPSAAERATRNLNNMANAKSRMASNDLFTTYGFCNPITFNNTAMTSASSSITTIASDLDYIGGLQQVSARVVSLTNSRLALLRAEQTYGDLLDNATVRMSATRERVNSVLEIVNDQFTRETLSSVEYAYYLLSTAVNSKDYRAADNAYHVFIVSAENAENAADRLEERVNAARGFLSSCMQTVRSLEDFDASRPYVENTSRLLTGLRALELQFNNTPMSTDYLSLLEDSIEATCIETGTVLSAVASGLFSETLERLNLNLEAARDASEARGIELNDTKVASLLAKAEESIRLGKLESARELYDQALAASEELLEEAQGLNAELEAASEAIERAEKLLKEIRGSIGYMILRPDLSSVERTISKAKSVRNSDPERAKELAESAVDSMERISGTTSLVTYALFGAVLLFIILIASAVLLLVYFKKRRAAEKSGETGAGKARKH